MRRGGGYYFRKFSRWDLGIITSGLLAGRAEAQTALLDAENIRIADGTIKSRAGQKYLDEDIYVDETINGLYQYSRQYIGVGGAISFYRAYIFGAEDKLYLWDGVGDDTIWDITDGLNYSMLSDDIYCCTYQDWCYITTGKEIIKTDGTANNTILLSASNGLGNPSGALSFAQIDDGVGNLSNKRDYKYRYVKMNGSVVVDYSSFFTVQTASSLVNDNVNITHPASGDPDVTHIEIWCTKTYTTTAPTDWYRIIVASNNNNTHKDNVSDLVIEGYYTAYTGDDSIGYLNSINKLSFYKDRLYGIEEGSDPSLYRYSDIGNPEKWNVDSWIDVKRDDGDIIVMGVTLGQSHYIFKQRSIWVLTGDPDAIPLIEVRAGGDSSPNQTEYGLGCTSPRSIVVVGDTCYFYSKVHGVWSISNEGIKCISTNISEEIKGFNNLSACIYSASNGGLYYVITNPLTGIAWICDTETKAWLKDTNIKSPCFIIDSDGYMLGGLNGRINRYYHPDYDTDNENLIECMMRTHWVDLQDGNQTALLRYLQINAKDKSGFFTVQAFNQDEQQPIDTFAIDSNDTEMDFAPNSLARIVSLKMRWTIGELESLYLYFLKRRSR
jgi:hypothetical protein